MNFTRRLALIAVTAAILGTGAAAFTSAQGTQPLPAADPDLVNAIAKEIGSTQEQAAGAAGALFGIAKSRLKPAEFSQVSAAVPGMDALLKAAPAVGGVPGVGGVAGGLAGAAMAFSKLGLKPELVSKVVPIVTSFVTKSGGSQVGNLLASVLK